MSAASQAAKALADLKNIKLSGLRFRIVDAKDQVVGRLAAQVAVMLQGKDKPLYNPKRNEGDVVIVVNAAHVRLTHDKWETKLYRWHTGFPGGLKERRAVDQWERNPTRILADAVRGMLPKNKLRLPRMDKLKVFSELTHPYKALELVPYVPPVHRIPDRGLGWSLPAGFAPLSPERYAFRLKTAQALREAPRPPLDFSDLLGDEERHALAASRTSGAASSSAGSSLRSGGSGSSPQAAQAAAEAGAGRGPQAPASSAPRVQAGAAAGSAKRGPAAAGAAGSRATVGAGKAGQRPQGDGGEQG